MPLRLAVYICIKRAKNANCCISGCCGFGQCPFSDTLMPINVHRTQKEDTAAVCQTNFDTPLWQERVRRYRDFDELSSARFQTHI